MTGGPFLSGAAVVTGAAGGIGRAVTAALTSAGVAVAAFDTDPAVGALTADPAGSSPGGRVRGYQVDVACRAAVDAAVEAAEADLGPLTALVNAAGVLRPGPTLQVSDKDWADTFAVNTTGVFNVSCAVAAHMVPRRRGAIVTIASNAARTSRWGMAAYAASKAAAASFTKCLGLELAGYGIRCNVVAPGSTATPMLTSLWGDGDAAAASLTGAPDQFRTGIPLGKLAQPDDIAAAVLFLLSDQASHITLGDLTVDGGAALGA